MMSLAVTIQQHIVIHTSEEKHEHVQQQFSTLYDCPVSQKLSANSKSKFQQICYNSATKKN